LCNYKEQWNALIQIFTGVQGGVIEGVFGGLGNRRLLFTRYRKESMKAKHIIAMTLVHNIGTSKLFVDELLLIHYNLFNSL